MNFTMTVGTKHEAFVYFSYEVLPAALEVCLTHPKRFLGWVVVVKVKDVGMILNPASLTLATFVCNQVSLTLLH